MDEIYNKGDLLQLHTKKCEVVEGNFYSMTKDMSKISLYNVKFSPNGCKSEGLLHFYNTQVQNIVKLHNVKQLKIPEKECEEIKEVSQTFVYINQVDNSFHDAINDLIEYSFVALSTDGADMGRKCKMPFLVLSTPRKIYIFDTQVMQYHGFDAGLRKILEGESPKKIVHDSRKISDCLFHKHQVKLNSVFDTQVGDIIVTKNKSDCIPTAVKSLSECLNLYLGVQVDSLEDKLDIVQCTERPLATKIKETLAKNIAFLHRLSEAINEQMMLPFVRGVEFYVEHLRSCEDFKAWELSGKHKQVSKDFISAIEY